MKHRKLGDNLSVRRQIGEPLIELAEGLDNKSDAAVVREIIAEIELALSRGISRKTILNTVNEKTNRNIKFGAFVKILYRIRKRRKANNTNSKIISRVSTATTSTEIALIRNNPNNATDNQLIIHTDNVNYLSPVVEDEGEDNQEISDLEYRKNIGKSIDPKEEHARVERYREMKKRERQGKK